MKHTRTFIASLLLTPRRRVLPGIIVALLLSLGSACAITYPPASSFLYGNSSVNQVGQLSLVAGTGLPYRYLPPKNYNPAVKYPVIIFLHGQSERGTNNTAQLGGNANGAMALVSTASPDNQTNYPCFFVAPQATVSSGWSNVTTQIQDILTTLKQHYSIDQDRICLTGLSMGALSSWSIVADMPNTFSCLVPQSGGGGTSVNTMPKIPIWAFHAENDSTVVCNGTDNSVYNFRKRGFPVIYTRYTTGGHLIWSTAYQHPQLAAWIAAQRRGESMQGFPSVTISNATLGLSPLKITGTAATNSGLNITRVGWCCSTNGGSPGAADGVTNGTTTFSSASAAFTAAGLASYRIAIRKAIASTTSSFYYDIMSVQDAQTLILDRTSTAQTARSYTLYKPGGYNLLNPATGTGSANWDTWSVDVPLSSAGAGVNVAHVFAEMPSGSASLGGRTSINQPLTVTYVVPTGDTTAPTLAITNPASSFVSTASTTVALSGTASDAVGVTSVTWSSDRGGSGTATGTNVWSIPDVALAVGLNVITVAAKDAKNNTATSVLKVNCTAASTLQFSAATYSGTENGGAVTITVRRTGASAGAVSVSYATNDGTATSGSDYGSATGVVNFLSGDMADKTFVITPLADQRVEGTETVLLTLSNPTGGSILGGLAVATLNIEDSAFDTWREQNFGANANDVLVSGPLADPDGDGLTNLLEYATDTNPTEEASARHPQPMRNAGNQLELSYNKNPNATDIVWSAASSGDLLSWDDTKTTLVTNTANTFAARDNIQHTTPLTRFLRFKLTSLSTGAITYTHPVGTVTTLALGNSDTSFSTTLQRPPSYQGLVSSVANNVVTVQGNPNWTTTPPKFVYAEGVQPDTYLLEFLSGTKVGEVFFITANSADTLTLNLEGRDLSGITVDTPLRVFPCWTLGTLFSTGVFSTSSINGTGAITRIMPFSNNLAGINPVPSATYYRYSGSGSGGPGWRSLGGGFTNIKDDVTLPPGTACMIRQDNQPGNALISVTGVVPMNARQHWLKSPVANKEQDQWLALDEPQDMTLAQSKLFESGSFEGTTAINGSSGDRLLIFDNTLVGYNKVSSKTYYYYTGTGYGGAGWRQLGAAFNSLHNDDVAFTTGSAFVIRRRPRANTTPDSWSMPLPY